MARDLAERWILAGGTPVFLRSAEPSPDAPAVLHLHGFAISGSYLVPTASELADRQRTYVPDLPGFGRSPQAGRQLTIDGLADAAADVLDAVGVEQATVLGNSLGCPVLASFAMRHADRIERAVMVSPAGGVHNQPLLRAVGQLAADGPREPMAMAAVAVPDYLHFGVVDSLRLFVAMTRFDAFAALMAMEVPLLAVLGTRDPLLAPSSRIRHVARMRPAPTTVAVIKGAAHAINFSHPRELALLVDAFVSDRPPDLGSIDPSLAPIALVPAARG